ncbi:GerMN domain-containing protein [Schumannella sp. 10F1B-5-1]|uniref:GerMN domain-containing protein n=1 Tax=Schumannella sp. 10F1B-5-1 TaxID=2590780 RepID=UPI0015E85415|nr:GerMN domain-containing protein [Schumannella sp. 10F1B-5-1]
MSATSRIAPRSRLATALAAALAALALLAGCVSIPTSGGVTAHDRTADSGDDGGFAFLPRGPQKGDTQEEILRGFLRAGLGPDDRYGVARSFLTTDFSSSWNPNASVTISDGSDDTITRAGDDRLTLETTVTARVDATGQYQPLATSVTDALGFRFVKEKGEWRIAEAPDGTVLSPGNFATIFEAYPLYFFDPSGDFLVPDLRWFPTLPTTSERIVRTLLQGPASWLGSGAVISAFPSGTQLGGSRVIVGDDGTARVDVSDEVLGESTVQKRRMLLQLLASLRSLDNVTQAEMTVGDIVVDVPGGPATGVDSDPQVDSSPLGVRDGAFGYLTSTGVRELGALSDRVAALAPVAVALDRDQTSAAVLTSGGVARAVASATPGIVDGRRGLVAPGIDPLGFIWSAPSSDPGAILAIDVNGVQHPVALSTPMPAGAILVDLEVARDGARVLLSLSTPTGPMVLVEAVQRDGDGVPVRLGAAVELPMPTSAGGVVDAAWIDGTSVAVMTQRGGGGVQVRAVQIGGRSTDLGAPVSGVRIVGGNGGSGGVRVLSAEGQVLQRGGAGWQATGLTASVLATQQ